MNIKDMNWYNKFIKISTRNELDIDAIKICQKMFSDFRFMLSSSILGNKMFSYNIAEVLGEKEYGKYNNAKVVINVSVEIYDGFSLAHGEFDIGGLTLNYGATKQDVELTVKMTKNFKQNNFRNFYMLLFNIARHELQHVYDNIRQKYDYKKTKTSYNDLVTKILLKSDEMLSEKELEPYIRGLMLRAKRERKSFIKIVKEFVDISFYAGNKITLMKYPVYRELRKIEENTVNQIMEKAKTIYHKVI